VAGYAMALVTYLTGDRVSVGDTPVYFSHSSNPGVIFFLILFLVILFTNMSVRCMASGMVIVGSAFVIILIAYFGWWDRIFGLLGELRIHLNLGAYLSFSTLMFLVWAATVFGFDRMHFYRVKPGQVTEEYVFGTGSRSFDTDGMLLEKHRSDLFRHWILGLGAGDLTIQTMGANRDTLHIPNVLFLGSKVDDIQRLISIRPEEFGRATVT